MVGIGVHETRRAEGALSKIALRGLGLLAVFGAMAFGWGCSGDTGSPNTGGSDAGDTGRDGGGDAGPTGSGFVVHYSTAWSSPHVHFESGGAWTTVPGKAMQPEGDGWYRYEHPVATLGEIEFVFNDGGTIWDNNGEKNYRTELREFWVKAGIIYPTKPAGPPKFCDDVECGHGTCNEVARRCDCDNDYVYDAATKTCVADLCAQANCGDSLCDPRTGECTDACEPDRQAGDFEFCTLTTDSSYSVVVKFTGQGQLDLGSSETKLNGARVDLSSVFDSASQTFRIFASGVAPSKYSYLFRLKRTSGGDLRPLFIPFWIGAGARYADFGWKDAILYQVMTDRFRNGDRSNDIDNREGSLSQVTDQRSQWQGGDFRGIIDKIEDGYFESMGINALWISSVVLNSHGAQPEVDPNDTRRASSYHAYHPIVTGYTHRENYGYTNPIETAFGTPAELHELVNKAHARGIRVLPDLVANHVQSEAQIYKQHPEWFHPYNQCHNNWDSHRLDCWFTTTTPDFDFGRKEARSALIDHAVWLAQEFNFDGYRADALKHMNDEVVIELKTAVKDELETTVDNHDLSDEATIFYMVGESLGGWARYHVRADMVQGQVDEGYYNLTKGALLTFQNSVRDLANFTIPNDTAYLTPQETFGGRGGYPGAVMGNFFGNHDQVRALTEAGGDHRRLRLAQAFLMTSPGNIPMLYQGDDIGTLGGAAPDNRAMMNWQDLSQEQRASLENMKKLGKLREAHSALRRGTRQSVRVEDWFWAYKVTLGPDEVHVVINRDADKRYDAPAGFTDRLGNCSGGAVPSLTACVFAK